MLLSIVMPYTRHSTLKTPRPVTALALASLDALSVGSGKLYPRLGSSSRLSLVTDDGSVRLYTLPSTTVVRAIRALGSEITSISWAVAPEDDSGEIWIACGKKVGSALRERASTDLCVRVDNIFSAK